MKTVYISEKSIETLRENRGVLKKNPSSSLVDKVDRNKTVFRDNSAFPNTIDDDFLLSLLYKGFEDSKSNLKKIKKIDGNANTIHALQSELIKKAIDLERPLRPHLEKLCYNIIVNIFNIPEDAITMDLTLVDNIDYSDYPNVNIDKSDKSIESDDDLIDIDKIKGEIEKRSIITALCIGAGLDFSSNIKSYISELYDLNPELGHLYRDIIAINNYLAYITDGIDINDSNKGQLGISNLNIKYDESSASINASALLFPVLLSETIRCLMELFASHGLPDNIKLSEFILGRTDYLKAEHIYMIVGKQLWNAICPNDIDTHLIPYYFKRICCLKIETFNNFMNEVLSNSKKGEKYIDKLISLANEDMEDDSSANFEKEKGNRAIITDEYIHEDEL